MLFHFFRYFHSVIIFVMISIYLFTHNNATLFVPDFEVMICWLIVKYCRFIPSVSLKFDQGLKQRLNWTAFIDSKKMLKYTLVMRVLPNALTLWWVTVRPEIYRILITHGRDEHNKISIQYKLQIMLGIHNIKINVFNWTGVKISVTKYVWK